MNAVGLPFPFQTPILIYYSRLNECVFGVNEKNNQIFTDNLLLN